MTKKQFEQELRSLSYEDLISLLLKTRQAIWKEILNPSQKKRSVHKQPSRFLAKYIGKLKEAFATSLAPTSVFKAEMVLKDLIYAGGTDRDIAFFRLSYANCCAEEQMSFGEGPDLREAAEENFKAALEYAKEDEIFFSDNVELFRNVAEGFPEHLEEYLDEALLVLK